MNEIYNPIDDVPPITVDQKSCICCGSTKILSRIAKDRSFRAGRRDRCGECENALRLSVDEHYQRLREENLNSFAVKSQKWAHQDDYRNAEAREGRRMAHNDFIRIIKLMCPDLYIIPGGIRGDWAMYKTYPCRQPRLATPERPEGLDFEYLGYCPSGILPEYSIIEFDDRDVAVKESRRGWRTILLRLIKAGMVTPERVNEIFPEADGEASTVWKRQLYVLRNGHEPD